MKTVWKYRFTVTQAENDILIPEGGRVLFVGVQDNEPQMWIEVYSEAPKVMRTFEWVGTGEKVPRGGQYLGTVILYNDTLVLHLYEINHQSVR